jgi:outer membrane PBP1 activator LpoA protein
MWEKAKNKRMKNPSLSAQDSLHDEVAYVLTTATLLKEVQSAVQTDQQERWQLNATKILSENAKTAAAQQQLSTYPAAAIQTD